MSSDLACVDPTTDRTATIKTDRDRLLSACHSVNELAEKFLGIAEQFKGTQAADSAASCAVAFRDVVADAIRHAETINARSN